MAERPIQRISPLDLRRDVAVGVPFPLGGTPIFSSTFSTQDHNLRRYSTINIVTENNSK